MSLLITCHEEGPGSPLLETSDPEEITAALLEAGCDFERREIRPSLSPQAPEAEVLADYRDLAGAEVAAHGFRKVDVAGIAVSDDPACLTAGLHGHPVLPDPQGWAGVPTGSDINERFPDYDWPQARHGSRQVASDGSGA